MVNVSALPPLERMNELSLSGLVVLLTGRKTLPEDSFAISDEASFDDWEAEDSSSAVQSLDAQEPQERDTPDDGDYLEQLAKITNNSRKTMYFNNHASRAYDAKYLKLFTSFMEKNAGRVQTPFAHILGMGMLNEISRFMVTFIKAVIHEFPFLFVGTLDHLKKVQAGIGAVKKHPNGHALAYEFTAISIGRFNSIYMLPAVVEILEKTMKGTGVAYSNFGSPIADLYSTVFSTEIALHSQLVALKENVAALSLTIQGPDGSVHGALHPKEVFQIVGSFMMQMYFVDAVNRSSMQEIFDKIRNSSITTLAALIDEVERLTQAGKLTVELSRSASSSAMVAVATSQQVCFNWQRSQSCHRGNNCPYSHEGGASQPVRSTTAGALVPQDDNEVQRYKDHFAEMDSVCRLFLGIFKTSAFSHFKIGHYFRRVSIDIRGQNLQGFSFQRDVHHLDKPCRLPLLARMNDARQIHRMLSAETANSNDSLPLLATTDLKCISFPSALVALPPPNELFVSQQAAQGGSSGHRSSQGARNGKHNQGSHGSKRGQDAHGGKRGQGAHGNNRGQGAHSGGKGQGAHGGGKGQGAHGGGKGQGAHGGGPSQSFHGHSDGGQSFGGQHAGYGYGPGQVHQVQAPAPPPAPPSSLALASPSSNHGGPMVSGGYVGHGSAHHAAQVLPQDQLIRQAQQHAFLAGQRDMQMQQQQQWSTQQLMSQQQQQQWAQQQWTPQHHQQPLSSSSSGSSNLCLTTTALLRDLLIAEALKTSMVSLETTAQLIPFVF